MNLTTELTHLIELFNKMAAEMDAEVKPDHSEYFKGMNAGMVIAYKSAANHLDGVIKQFEALNKINKEL